MARTPVEGAGNGPHDAQPTILTVTDGQPVHLPEGLAVGSLELARDGQDLVMTAPDGQVFVIEGYFLQPDAPLVMGGDGSLLTPALVQSFLKIPGDAQVAALDQINDESPVGEVTEVSGAATITHADGTKEKVAVGTQVFEGDIIETDAKGAVNIHFADDSTFAVSQNARLAVDDFSFNPEDQSGSTGLSILRGVFMFTSGLIGRENPDAVTLETPVGSIGIRGTIIGGEINEGGKSQISVIEGAIVVRNGAGEQILSDQFETVQLTGFNAPITNVGTLNAGQMSQSYGAVRSVSPTLFTSIDDTAKDPAQQQQQPAEQAPAQDAAPEAAPAEPATPAAPSALNEAPVVFQTLDNGAHQNNTTAATTQPAAEPTPVAAAPAPAPVTVAPPAPVVQQQAPVTIITPPVTTQPTVDPRAPSSVAFTTGGMVDEQAASGTVVGTIAQTQSLPFTVTYSLANNPGNLFTINATTGVISLINRAGDYDTGTTHHDIVIRATRADTGQHTDTALSVNLNPVDEAPVFSASSANIALNEGAMITLNVAMINAVDPEGSAVSYSVTNLNKGIFIVDGQVENSFTQAQLIEGKVRYAHNGDEPGGAGFTLTPTDGSHAGAAKNFTVNVSPENDLPIQVSNTGGSMDEGAAKGITLSMLNHTDTDNTPAQITYEIQSINGGTVQLMNGAWVNTTTFTQQDIIDGKVRFLHNGQEGATAAFTYDVSDGTYPLGGTLSFTVTPVDDAPVQVNHPSTGLALDEDGAFILNEDTLEYTDSDTDPTDIVFTVPASNYGSIEIYNGTAWVQGTNFTQQDLYDEHVRFVHDGHDGATASFNYTVTDGTTSSTPKTVSFAVTQLNDAPDSVTVSNMSLSERSGGSTFILGNVSIVDQDGSANNPAYTFAIERYNSGTSTWVTDTSNRFSVYNNAGTWQLEVKSGAAFDHETEPTIQMRIVLTDDDGITSHTRESNVFTITVNDVNETATNLTINDGLDFSGTTDLLIQGMTPGAILGVLNFNDPDTNPTFKPTASNFHITAASGGGLSPSSFEVVQMTDDTGHKEFVLRLNPSLNPNGIEFPLGHTSQLTLWFDANQDNVNNAGDITQTYTLQGRNDMMILDSVNGKNGFMIDNNSRPNARFGASLTVGDINGDGVNDLVIGAPMAANPTAEISGGLYGFMNTANLTMDATNGSILLSGITAASPLLSGFSGEFTTSEDNGFGMYGAEVITLDRFNSANGADIVITNPGKGAVEIRSASGATTIITGIPMDGLIAANGIATGQEMAKNIHITSAGDLNGDGYTDLIISAPLYDGASGTVTNSGRIGIVFGGPNHTTNTSTPETIDFSTLSNNVVYNPSTSVGARFGAAITGLGDINGDGYADFAVSATGADTNSAAAGTEQGRVYVYLGHTNADLAAMPQFQISGLRDGEHLGKYLASAGDFNGDGLNDMLIRSDNSVVGAQGTIHLIYGNTGLTGGEAFETNSVAADFNHATIQWNINDAAISIGKAMGSAGDFNGDGFDDIYLDISRNLGGDNYEHTLMVLYGSSTPNAVYNLDQLLNNTANNNLAFKIRVMETSAETLTVSGAGDINGDGYDDLLIGDPTASHTDTGNPRDGAAYLVYGNDYNDVNNMSFELRSSTAATASANGQSYVGDYQNNTVSASAYTGISFNGAGGNDTLVLKNGAANTVQNFDGGSGVDTIRLFYSYETEIVGTSDADMINLVGIGGHVSGVEVINFDSTSRTDTLKLDIKDILSLMHSSDSHSLTINSDALAGMGNSLVITNGGGTGVSLASLGFTKDMDLNTTPDRANLHGTDDAYVYTHVDSGFQLIVDSRLAGAETLAG